jgi:PII-like signaling protein
MSLATHRKKRIEVIVEAPVLSRMLDGLDRLSVTGYTVLPALAGRGRTGNWRRDDAVNPAGQMVCVVCITDQQKVAGILDAVHSLLSRQIGIVSVCDVEVIRQEHF